MIGQQADQTLESTVIGDLDPAITTDAPSESALGQTVGPLHDPFPTVPVDLFPNLDINSFDANMDLAGEVNQYNWVKSANGMEWDARA